MAAEYSRITRNGRSWQDRLDDYWPMRTAKEERAMALVEDTMVKRYSGVVGNS
jgi:hypothetical protein